VTANVYSFQDERGAEQGYRTLDPVAARQHALLYRLRCVAHECDLTDGDVAWDFTRPPPVPGVDP
jgi:hypothetical protein